MSEQKEEKNLNARKLSDLQFERQDKFDHYYPNQDLALKAYNETLNGWKLHLSVNRKKFQEALEIVAPKLAEQGYIFKYTIPDSDKHGRGYSNAQFTIYLKLGENEEGDGQIPPEKVKQLILVPRQH